MANVTDAKQLRLAAHSSKKLSTTSPTEARWNSQPEAISFPDSLINLAVYRGKNGQIYGAVNQLHILSMVRSKNTAMAVSSRICYTQ